MSPPPLAGVLLLDKPLGLSSNAALQRVRGLCGRPKAGHTGSLDPLASGMLPICLGEATKLAGELLQGRKSYLFTLRLGLRSETGDAEGRIIEQCPVLEFSAAQLSLALQGFMGEGLQVPPMYSALKREGEPLYRLARRGEEVERAARPIRIDAFELLERTSETLQLRVLCSKGTYVRVLGEDLAHALGSCGHLIALRREFVEPFSAAPMWTLEQLSERVRQGEGLPLLAADQAVPHLPAVNLTDAEALALTQGRVLHARAAASALWRLYDHQQCFLGLGQSDECGDLRVRRLFNLQRGA